MLGIAASGAGGARPDATLARVTQGAGVGVAASYSEFHLLVAQDAVDAVAQRLALRGHRWVTVRDDGVESLCVNPPSADSGGRWQDCETAAVEAIAREYGGYLGSAGEGSGASPERHFLREGRRASIELDAETALQRRRVAIAAFPTQLPEPAQAGPFDDDPEPGWDGDFLAVVREISRRLLGDPQAAFDMAAPDGPGSGWVPGAADEFIGELHNAVMHQDACYPHTAEAVPLIVALATDERMPFSVRDYAYGMLYSAASNGDRLIAYLADKLIAEGDGIEVGDGLRLTHAAVQAEAASLFARWDREPGAIRMTLAALAATYPSQAAASGLLPELAEFAQRWAGTYRGAALRLASAAAQADDQDTLAQVAAIESWHWKGPLAGGSPLAPARSRALYLLDEMLLVA
ncbi:hypothetical protein KDK95_17710 [Actinospica sp. MGRD01-02]|uniref:Uncharacterized protein n=1 Tax=Actinospica acidithermotolerans TaxID=2828514 RepID=A0A941ECM0_9ACTN|nr:hypothetical protein [Actinospica acidithermotolerans]MBR7828158.1 hypothetical protein [Actinospica acidithermotolerans]